MNTKIFNAFMDEIYSKNEKKLSDSELENAVEIYITTKGIEERWKKSGLDDSKLNKWLTLYLAPIKSLSYEQTVNFFVDNELLREIDSERVFFNSLSECSNIEFSESELQKRYDDLCDMCAPLILKSGYDDYIHELLSVARLRIREYLKTNQT